MGKLTESEIFFLKKYAGTLTESEHMDFMKSRSEKMDVDNMTVKFSPHRNDGQSSNDSVNLNFEISSNGNQSGGYIEFTPKGATGIEEEKDGIAFYMYLGPETSVMEEVEGGAVMQGEQVSNVIVHSYRGRNNLFPTNEDLKRAVEMIVRQALSDRNILSRLV